MAGQDKAEKLARIYEAEGRNTSSTDPKMMEARVFIGNLASDLVNRQDMEKMFGKYGKILGVSLHKSFGFIQFENKEQAEDAVKGEKGKMLKGLKMDLCIATERRRDPGAGAGARSRRPPRPRSRSPRRRRPKEWEREGERWPWLNRRPSPPPPRLRDPYRDPYFRDDPYHESRYDRYSPMDPYDRFPPPLPPPRGYGRPSLPMRPRDRFEMDPWGEGEDLYLNERERPLLPPPRDEPPSSGLLPKPTASDSQEVELEIIVVSQQQKEYAHLVRQQVESLGVQVELRQLSPTMSLVHALSSASSRGCLYTIIITSQHETHRSVTLTILHGRNPQEHKNMPLADAIGLIERDYERHRQTTHLGGGRRSPVLEPHARAAPSDMVRGGIGGGGSSNATNTGGGGSNDDVASLMSKAASGTNLSTGELSTLITMLQQKQQQNTVRQEPAPTTAEDIQQQQADLQSKILSLLGSNAIVPSVNKSASSASSQDHNNTRGILESFTSGGYGGYGHHGSGGAGSANNHSQQQQGFGGYR